MATILAVDDEQPILELIKNGLQKGRAYGNRLCICGTSATE